MKAIAFGFFLVMTMTQTIFAQTPQLPPLESGVSQTLAKWRAANYSDVRYKLNITLEKRAPLLKGEIEISVKLTDEAAKNDLVLDWRTTQFENDKDKPFAEVVKVNAQFVKDTVPNGVFDYHILKEHILVSKKYLKTGENTLLIKFASPIKTSGAAITRYIDKEDGAEYIYSLFVPSDASTAFPVFDQPDLKAKFKLKIILPDKWKAISNTDNQQVSVFVKEAGKAAFAEGATNYQTTGFYEVEFEETKPISAYVFAFAAGEFSDFDECDYLKQEGFRCLAIKREPSNTKRFSSNIYVRKSQAEKFKQHAAEVFRLNREGVKFLESYFDYKYPFPKYDLVLIPEFPFGGMEHAGATFLRESSIIFPSEPTANDKISRANLIFHEAAHQWFGDTVTMRWFDDLWLKEGFAEFMAYKTLEKVMPEYDAWKVFYERNKPLAYLTDSTKGTTPIYQEIPNLSAAKSAYGNIVYRKAPSFLRQAEFFWGAEKFQRAVRAFLKKHEFANATWQDLVKEIEEVEIAEMKKSEYYKKLSDRDKQELENFKRWSVSTEWAEFWVEKRGTAVYRISPKIFDDNGQLEWVLNAAATGGHTILYDTFAQQPAIKIKEENFNWLQDVRVLKVYENGDREEATAHIGSRKYASLPDEDFKPLEKFKFSDFPAPLSEEERKKIAAREARKTRFVFPNYQDYGYGIFLLDAKSRDYVLKNIQNEKDAFLRSMMWGSLWDSVREAELDPKEYVELAIKNISVETDELTMQTILARVSTAINYYLSDRERDELAARVENVLLNSMAKAETAGQRITFYRALLSAASTDATKAVLKDILKNNGKTSIDVDVETKTEIDMIRLVNVNLPLKTKDKFDIVTRLAILGDADAPRLLAELQKTETSDDAKRYAYAVGAAFPSKEAKEKYFRDFLNNKEISESYIEAAFVPFNSVRHSELTLPYLEKALAELPNLKRNRKIFFVNGWLAAFIGGQRDEKALGIVNKFLADNPNLDKDLRLKILENLDALERAVKIRAKFGKK